MRGTNDSRLWAKLVGIFLDADVEADLAERSARRAVAEVRRARKQPGAMTWVAGDQIPDAIVWVYDLDGDVWHRRPGGEWMMSRFDPDRHEQVASNLHDDATLLSRYGPVTGVLYR